jgi:IclR family transcriptional regulator, acetate operon repressor
MRLSDLSRKTGLPKSTTHRMLNALLASDVVVRSGRSYKAARHPNNDPASSYKTLLRMLAPYLGDVLIRTGLTSSLAVLDDTEVCPPGAPRSRRPRRAWPEFAAAALRYSRG